MAFALNRRMGGQKCRTAALAVVAAMAMVCSTTCGFLGGVPVVRSPARSALPAVGQAAQLAKADIVEVAVTSAVYDMWAKEYPEAARAGSFQGHPAAMSDIADRTKVLQEALQVGWAEVMGLVRADSTVLFASSAEQVSSTFTKISEELGGREAAFDVLRMQPVLLHSNTGHIEGKGELLRSVAEFSDATRPLYRAARGASMAVAPQVLPRPLEVALLGLI